MRRENIPMPPNNLREFWSPERLERAAFSELLRHGGNKRDLGLLHEHFRKIAEEKFRDGVIQ